MERGKCTILAPDCEVMLDPGLFVRTRRGDTYNRPDLGGRRLVFPTPPPAARPGGQCPRCRTYRDRDDPRADRRRVRALVLPDHPDRAADPVVPVRAVPD